jgi:hypothetical protein
MLAPAAGKAVDFDTATVAELNAAFQRRYVVNYLKVLETLLLTP